MIDGIEVCVIKVQHGILSSNSPLAPKWGTPTCNHGSQGLTPYLSCKARLFRLESCHQSAEIGQSGYAIRSELRNRSNTRPNNIGSHCVIPKQ